MSDIEWRQWAVLEKAPESAVEHLPGARRPTKKEIEGNFKRWERDLEKSEAKK